MDNKFYILQLEREVGTYYNHTCCLSTLFILSKKPVIVGNIIVLRKDSIIKYKGQDVFIRDKNDHFIITDHRIANFEEYSDLSSIELLYSI